MEALPTDFDKDTQKKGPLVDVLTYLALLAAIAAALTFIGFAEAILPGSYSIIASLSILTGVLLIGRTLMKTFDAQTTEALAASIAPNAAAAAAAAAATPRNAEDVTQEHTEANHSEAETAARDAEEPGINPEQRNLQ